jgi:hypothetical protein
MNPLNKNKTMLCELCHYLSRKESIGASSTQIADVFFRLPLGRMVVSVVNE